MLASLLGFFKLPANLQNSVSKLKRSSFINLCLLDGSRKKRFLFFIICDSLNQVPIFSFFLLCVLFCLPPLLLLLLLFIPCFTFTFIDQWNSTECWLNMLRNSLDVLCQHDTGRQRKLKTPCNRGWFTQSRIYGHE